MKRDPNRFSWEIDGTFVDVTDKEAGRSFTYDVSAYSDEIRDNVLMFGAKSLFQARTSQTPANEKFEAFKALDAQLREGKWESDRAGAFGVTSPEVEAIAELKGCTIPEVQRALKGYDKAKRDKMYASSKVKELAEEIRARRAAAAEELDLSDLM